MAFESLSGIANKKAHLAALTIVICLYLMSLLPLFTVLCATYLLAAHTVDQANGVSEVLIVISSCVSICYTLTHSIAAGRQMQVARQQRQHNGLHTACFILVRLMVTLWFAASAVSLVVSLRQPLCIRDGVGASYRIDGGNCVLLRTSIRASLLAFFMSCALLFALEISNQPFQSHFLGISKPLIDKDKILRSVSLNTSNGSDFYKDVERCDNQNWNPRGMFPSNHSVPSAVPALPPRSSRRLPDLGRAVGKSPGSLHSLPATVPFLPPLETRMPLNWCWGLVPMQGPPTENRQHNYTPNPRDCPGAYSTTSSSVSSLKNPIITLPKSAHSPTRSTRSIPKRSPLSTMRRVSNPDVPIYEEFTGNRTQMPLTRSWESTGTIGNNDTRSGLANSQRTITQELTAAPLIVGKNLVATTTHHKKQHLIRTSDTPCEFTSVEMPDLAASLRNLRDMAHQRISTSP